MEPVLNSILMSIGSVCVINIYVAIMKIKGRSWKSGWFTKGTLMDNKAITLNYDNYAIWTSGKNNLTGICKYKADACFINVG